MVVMNEHYKTISKGRDTGSRGHCRLMIVTGEGQITKGDTLKILGKNPRDSQTITAKDVISVNGCEEVIINKLKNYYFITKLLINGESWAKQVEVID